MMEQKVDQLLEDMFDKTRRLASIVEKTDSEPDEWMAILDEREKVIHDVQLLLSEGYILTDRQKQQLEQMQELNLQMMPQMEQAKQHVKKKLDEIRQKKAARTFYNGSGLTGYGAFFDTRN